MTVSVYVPLAADDGVRTVSVDVPVVGFGMKVTLEPAGSPLEASATEPENPFVGVIVTVYVAVLPRRTDTDAGLSVSWKSLGATEVTVMLAVPLTRPLAALTRKGPPALGPALKSPDPLIVPPPLTDQVKAGWTVSGFPNGSSPVAVNCCVPFVGTDVEAGATVIELSSASAVGQRTFASNPPEGYWASHTGPPVKPGPEQSALAPDASVAPAIQLG